MTFNSCKVQKKNVIAFALALGRKILPTAPEQHPRQEPTTLQHVFSNYSPSSKQVNLRDYEPVETSLHPALSSSNEFDDPSMDERVMSGNIRLDLQQR